MEFTATTIDTSFNSLEYYYSFPYNIVGRKMRLAALAIFLVVAPINDEIYGAEKRSNKRNQQTIEFLESGNQYFSNALFTDIKVIMNQDEYKLHTRQIIAKWQRTESLNMLLKSFYSNFENDYSDLKRYTPCFYLLANELSSLKINYAFVDVSRKKEMIDFNINLDEGLFLSVAKRLEESTDNVMFSVARNHQALAIDEMPIKELVKKVSDVVTQLKMISRPK